MNIEKSDIFKEKYNSIKCSYESSSPKIVAAWSINVDKKLQSYDYANNYFNQNKEDIKNYLIKSLFLISKKKSNQEVLNRISKVDDKGFDKYNNKNVK